MNRYITALLEPVSPERHRVNRQRYESLPGSLKTPEQIIGHSHHSCGATHGVLERCDFACTSCYLGEEANAAEPLPKDKVFRQLDALRAFLGPQGKAQITAGEVTLLPRETLGEFVRYAIDIGLDPMVMTHGRRFLREPEYLESLITDYGLAKISIHVDSTQRGREEWTPFVTEEQLNPVRDRYADLIRNTRTRTGRKLHAAHTVTVTRKSLDQIPHIMRWFVRNLDAMHFGHPECHIMIPVVVARAGEQLCVLETVRAGRAWDRGYLQRLLRAVGGYTVRGKSRAENLLGIASLIVRNLPLLVESVGYGIYRTWGDRQEIARVLWTALRQRSLSIRPLVLVVHKFMSPDELETPLGRERLAACTFRVAVDGEMIPMCELNATGLRSRLYPAAPTRKAARNT